MRFSKISVTKKQVMLVRETRDASGANEEVILDSPERPLSTFADAMQAFVPYVVDLLEIPEAWRTNLTVTTLSLSEDKNKLRGLIVTATRPVEKAYNKPLVLNCPLVREGGENASADAFVLTEEVLELIDLAEAEATRYANGERVQLELMPKAETSATTREFNDRAAAAEVASTRRPRTKKKGADFIPGVGDVVNPEATEALTTASLRQLLLTVERDVPADAIEAWTASEREGAQRWAIARQKELVGTQADAKVPAEPKCILASATPPLGGDGWIDPKPVRVTDDGARAVRAHVQ